VGFLRWNFSPAQIFMGDGGAMFLGFLMATLGLKLKVAESTPAASWIVPLLILGVPIFDTTLISVSRARRGLLPFAAPGKDHAAHRLANLGLGQRSAVLALYGLGGAFGLLALLASRLPAQHSYALGVATLLVALLAVGLLEHAPYDQ
jgi:UDP-GlcNAc:undecaprenyl-phosphate GlcNAc-1-phosphate transferase